MWPILLSWTVLASGLITSFNIKLQVVILLILVLISLVFVAAVWIFETEDLDDFTHRKGTEKRVKKTNMKMCTFESEWTSGLSQEHQLLYWNETVFALIITNLLSKYTVTNSINHMWMVKGLDTQIINWCCNSGYLILCGVRKINCLWRWLAATFSIMSIDILLFTIS